MDTKKVTKTQLEEIAKVFNAELIDEKDPALPAGRKAKATKIDDFKETIAEAANAILDIAEDKNRFTDEQWEVMAAIDVTVAKEYMAGKETTETVETADADTKATPTRKKATKKTKADPSKSNKGQIYLAWKDGEEDINKLHKMVDEAVKTNTIKGWMKGWKVGKRLPAVAKQQASA